MCSKAPLDTCGEGHQVTDKEMVATEGVTERAVPGFHPTSATSNNFEPGSSRYGVDVSIDGFAPTDITGIHRMSTNSLL